MNPKSMIARTTGKGKTSKQGGKKGRGAYRQKKRGENSLAEKVFFFHGEKECGIREGIDQLCR